MDNNPSSVEKNMRLTEEQRQVLIQMEKEQKAAEEAKKLEAQRKEQEAYANGLSRPGKYKLNVLLTIRVFTATHKWKPDYSICMLNPMKQG